MQQAHHQRAALQRQLLRGLGRKGVPALHSHKRRFAHGLRQAQQPHLMQGIQQTVAHGQTVQALHHRIARGGIQLTARHALHQGIYHRQRAAERQRQRSAAMPEGLPAQQAVDIHRRHRQQIQRAKAQQHRPAHAQQRRQSHQQAEKHGNQARDQADHHQQHRHGGKHEHRQAQPRKKNIGARQRQQRRAYHAGDDRRAQGSAGFQPSLHQSAPCFSRMGNRINFLIYCKSRACFCQC